MPSVTYPSLELPAVIPTFNNPTYTRAMTEQLVRVGFNNLIIVDNASEFPPMLDLLAELASRFCVLRREENLGPRQLFRDEAFFNSLPQVFCITDPDLEFNPLLPVDFAAHLIALTEQHACGKAGFALDISKPDELIQTEFQMGAERWRIWDWEAHFWSAPLDPQAEDPAYRVWIDTTFAIYNKTHFQSENYLEGIRVAGRFTARHLPWYSATVLPAAEAEFYRRTSRYSFYAGTPPPA